MSRIHTSIFAAAVAGIFLFGNSAGQATAEFGGHSHSGHDHDHGYGGSYDDGDVHGHSAYYAAPVYGYGYGYGLQYYGQGYGYNSAYRTPTWHDTSHYDYVSPRVSRHGNHYHVRPGHYRAHNTGHWDE